MTDLDSIEAPTPKRKHKAKAGKTIPIKKASGDKFTLLHRHPEAKTNADLLICAIEDVGAYFEGADVGLVLNSVIHLSMTAFYGTEQSTREAFVFHLSFIVKVFGDRTFNDPEDFKEFLSIVQKLPRPEPRGED